MPQTTQHKDLSAGGANNPLREGTVSATQPPRTDCKNKDAFIPPSPFPSWILNEDTCLWDAPVARPNDGNRYQWNEETTSWDEVTE